MLKIKSLGAQDEFLPIPGFISCAGVTGSRRITCTCHVYESNPKAGTFRNKLPPRVGLEPTTFSVLGWSSTSWATEAAQLAPDTCTNQHKAKQLGKYRNLINRWNIMYMNIRNVMSNVWMLWSDVTELQDTPCVFCVSYAHSLLMRANKLETAAAQGSLALTVPLLCFDHITRVY